MIYLGEKLCVEIEHYWSRALFWIGVSAWRQKKGSRRYLWPHRNPMLLPATDPVIEECCRCFVRVNSSIATLSAVPLETETEGMLREDGWKSRPRGSGGLPPSVRQCVTTVLLVLSLYDPCRVAWQEDRRGSAASLSQFITGLDQTGFVQGNKKNKGLCTALSVQRGQSNHAGDKWN